MTCFYVCILNGYIYPILYLNSRKQNVLLELLEDKIDFFILYFIPHLKAFYFGEIMLF